VGFFDRLFGKKQPKTATTNAPEIKRVPGMETMQTADEQATTRRHMEEELDAQREKRGQPTSTSE